jgi:hypothetical protein
MYNLLSNAVKVHARWRHDNVRAELAGINEQFADSAKAPPRTQRARTQAQTGAVQAAARAAQ